MSDFMLRNLAIFNRRIASDDQFRRFCDALGLAHEYGRLVNDSCGRVGTLAGTWHGRNGKRGTNEVLAQMLGREPSFHGLLEELGLATPSDVAHVVPSALTVSGGESHPAGLAAPRLASRPALVPLAAGGTDFAALAAAIGASSAAAAETLGSVLAQGVQRGDLVALLGTLNLAAAAHGGVAKCGWEALLQALLEKKVLTYSDAIPQLISALKRETSRDATFNAAHPCLATIATQEAVAALTWDAFLAIVAALGEKHRPAADEAARQQAGRTRQREQKHAEQASSAEQECRVLDFLDFSQPRILKDGETQQSVYEALKQEGVTTVGDIHLLLTSDPATIRACGQVARRARANGGGGGKTIKRIDSAREFIWRSSQRQRLRFSLFKNRCEQIRRQ